MYTMYMYMYHFWNCLCMQSITHVHVHVHAHSHWWCFDLTEQVHLSEESINNTSRVFFLDSGHMRKVTQETQDASAPCVSFRGLMDPVRHSAPSGW